MKVLFAGDIHGDTVHLMKLARIAKRNGVEKIVQVGDFGFLFDPKNPKLTAASNALKQNAPGCSLWFVCGNHENYSMLEALGAFEDNDQPTMLSENIVHLPRGYGWEWDGVTFGSLGGAKSTDIEPDSFCYPPWPGRTYGVDVFTQETITNSQRDRCISLGSVDVLVTHDAPEPMSLELLKYVRRFKLDREADVESKVNRLQVSKAIDALNPSLHVHGHMHFNYRSLLNDTIVAGLDRNKRSGSYFVLDLSEFHDVVNRYKETFRKG